MSNFKTELENILWCDSLKNFPIFKIMVDSHDQMTFINALNNQDLRYTTPVVDVKHLEHGICVTTKSGSTYTLYNVNHILAETSITVSKDLETVENEDHSIENLSYNDFPKFTVETESKSIYYGDGFNARHYTFDESISEEDFKKFCILEGLNMKYIDGGGAWYEDYAKIENRDDLTVGGKVLRHETEGKQWTYKWVRVYTD